MATHYDRIILGSGQAGTPLSGEFAKAGLKTALVDQEYIGGCCVNVGCTPTKTMVASGRAAYLARRGADYGVNTGPITVDMSKVRQRKRYIVTSFRGGNESRTASAGVDILMGSASFTSTNTVTVKLNGGGEKSISADKIFINTGERPAKPKLDGLEDVETARVLDSTSVQELGEVPGHLIVIGGGYVGLEFGQLFRRLGAEVTIIQRGAQVLPREDKDLAECMLNILKEDGITVYLNSSASSISKTESSPIVLKLADKEITGTHILFAAGRIPNTNSLGLSAAGVLANSRGYVQCNEFLETNVPNIYVLGDVKGPPAFTHISYDDFRIIRHNLIRSLSPAISTNSRQVPYVVYTDPQLGHVGLHEHEARKQGLDIQVAIMPMTWVARALETDETRGMMKGIVEKGTGKILGFTCLGIEGGEVMAVVQMAMTGGVSWQVLQDTVWAHPSLAESLNNLWAYLK